MSSHESAEDKAALKKVRAAALALLSRRSYTRRRLEEKLGQKGFEAEAVKGVIGDLSAWGYIDDYAYALRLAEYGLKIKGWGSRRAGLELKAKGVGPEERRQALDEVYGPVEEMDLARQAAAKRKQRHPADPLKARRQMAGYLARRGFSGEVISQVLREEED